MHVSEKAGDVAQFLNSMQMRPLMIFGNERLAVNTGTIAYAPRSNELGPAVRPQIAIGLMAACCIHCSSSAWPKMRRD